jgi:hypothetical protein
MTRPSECKGGVTSGVLHHYILSSGMFIEESGHIIDQIIDNEPTVVVVEVFGHFGQSVLF